MANVQLEPWGEGDLPLLRRLMGDPAMTEHLGGPESEEKLVERQARYERVGEPGAGRMFKIVDPATGDAMGSVGYWEKEGRGDRRGHRRCPRGAQAPVPARVPVGRERPVECHLPQARLRAPRGARLRVPARPSDALQRLAPRPDGTRGRKLERLAQLLERADLDLPGALGRQAELTADLAQGLRRLAEPVVRVEHPALALFEPIRETVDFVDLDVVEHVLEGLLGAGIDDAVPDRGRSSLLGTKPLLDSARCSFGRLQALELRPAKPGRATQRFLRGLVTVGLQVLVTH